VAPKKDIDWEAIQREYRAGILSVREIATMHGVSHTAINKRAKKDSKHWQRDLTKKIQAAVARKLSIPVSKKKKQVSIADEETAIEEAADRALAVIKRHRVSIMKLDDTKVKLLKELHNNPKKLWIGQFQGRVITKVVSIAVTERATALLALAGVEERRIKLERQAFGINDGPPEDGKITEIPIVFDAARPQ